MRLVRSAVHRAWRLLPARSRRSLFVRATTLMVPSRGQTSQTLPVVIAGLLSSATGLGESARLNVDGARRAGLPYATVDLSGSWLGEADLPIFSAPGQTSPIGPGTLVLHTPGSTLPYALVRCGRSIVQGKRLVGFWHWELPALPDDWRFGCDRLDEIWVPSAFCAAAVRQRYDGRIRIIPHPVDVGDARRHASPNHRFTAITIFNMASGFQRKNPLASLRAFQRAFGSDPGAHLIVKVVNPDHYPEGMAALVAEAGDAANIEILARVLPRTDVLQLIADADAVLSLHRSEGFGMLAAEAMLIGTPVIATDWSATAEFLGPDTGMPIPYRLVPAIDPQGCSHDPAQNWADPDVDAAAAALVQLRERPDDARHMADRARQAAAGLFSQTRYVGLIKDALQAPSHEP